MDTEVRIYNASSWIPAYAIGRYLQTITFVTDVVRLDIVNVQDGKARQRSCRSTPSTLRL